jgi:hypothetical protein
MPGTANDREPGEYRCILISLPSALMRQFEERGPIDGPSVPTNAPHRPWDRPELFTSEISCIELAAADGGQFSRLCRW